MDDTWSSLNLSQQNLKVGKSIYAPPLDRAIRQKDTCNNRGLAPTDFCPVPKLPSLRGGACGHSNAGGRSPLPLARDYLRARAVLPGNGGAAEAPQPERSGGRSSLEGPAEQQQRRCPHGGAFRGPAPEELSPTPAPVPASCNSSPAPPPAEPHKGVEPLLTHLCRRPRPRGREP